VEYTGTIDTTKELFSRVLCRRERERERERGEKYNKRAKIFNFYIHGLRQNTYLSSPQTSMETIKPAM
jgi:hypothetical protein